MLLSAFACSPKITVEDLNTLNGYWEISMVKFPDGNEKTYQVNTTVDFIEFDNGKGFRKKVQPNLQGSFRTSDDAEQFVIQQQDGKYIMQYQNADVQWEEELLKVSENSFSVKNEENITYVYSRFQTLNLEE